MIKLKNILTEADTATIAANLTKAYEAGPAAMRAYLDGPEGSSEEARAILQKQAADNDGEASDDKISIGKGGGAAMDYMPTQNEIDLMSSVSYPLGSAKTLIQAINNPTAAGIVTSGQLIIDGHHRWSGAIGIGGSDAKVDSTDIQWPGKDTAQILAAAQLTIAAKLGGTQKTPSQSAKFATNILGASADKITKMIMANLGQKTDAGAPGPLLNKQMCYDILKDPSMLQTINKWSGGSVQPLKEISLKQKKAGEKAVDELRLSIAQKVAENLAALPKPDNAPVRADMPQFDPKVKGPKAKDVIGDLGAGNFNVTPPFAKESIQNKKSIITKNTMKQKSKISIAEQKEMLKMKRTARIISESEYQKRLRLIEDAEADKIDATLYPNKLSKVNADIAKKLTNNENPGDEDTAKGSKADVAAESLKASQTTMDFAKFVGMSIQMMAKIGNFSGGAGGDLGAIISNDNHIMDGHHRWAATLMIDPKEKVGGIFINLPGEKLVGVLNVWTVANGGKGKPSDTNLSSLTGDAVAEKFKEMCNKGGGFLPTPEEILKKFKENGFDSLEVATEHVKKNWESTPTTRKTLGWMPAKIDMPAIEPDQLDKVKSDIENGKLDLNAPYQTKVKEESKNHILRDLESILQESITTWKNHRRK